MAEHVYAGGCPDETQPEARDANCPACELIVETGRLREQVAALTRERDDWRGRAEREGARADDLARGYDALKLERDALIRAAHTVVGEAIPPGAVTSNTEMVFVCGLAFVNAAKHEETVGRVAASRDALKAELASVIDECDALISEHHDVTDERDEAIRERAETQMRLADVAAETAVLREDCRVALEDLTTLLEVIFAVAGERFEPSGRAFACLKALYEKADEIAKRTGYAGGQGDG